MRKDWFYQSIHLVIPPSNSCSHVVLSASQSSFCLLTLKVLKSNLSCFMVCGSYILKRIKHIFFFKVLASNSPGFLSQGLQNNSLQGDYALILIMSGQNWRAFSWHYASLICLFSFSSWKKNNFKYFQIASPNRIDQRLWPSGWGGEESAGIVDCDFQETIKPF